MHCRDESIYPFGCERFADYTTTSKMMVAGNPTPRIYPRDLVVKTRRINYDPVMELYYYKVTESQIRGP
mgnify:CR=1 FL=1